MEDWTEPTELRTLNSQSRRLAPVTSYSSNTKLLAYRIQSNLSEHGIQGGPLASCTHNPPEYCVQTHAVVMDAVVTIMVYALYYW